MTYYYSNEKRGLSGSQALKDASETELRVLLCLSETEGADAAHLASAAGCSEAEAEAALTYWRGAGFVRKSRGSDPRPSSVPVKDSTAQKTVQREFSVSYSADELADRVKKYKLASLMAACQQLTGRELGRVELNTVVYLREQLELGEDYIYMLLSWCREIGKPSFKYMEKVAFSLMERDVRDAGALETYIENQRAYRSGEGKIRRLFGIGDRAPSSKEKAFLEKWILQFGYGEEIVGIAYDITVNNTGKAAMAYADKMLSSWHLAGCRTPEDVQAEIERERAAKFGTAPKTQAQKKNTSPKAESFDPEDAWKRALERSYGDRK